eukprot:4927849-Lingulodinium_polyedra.AAC.1
MVASTIVLQRGRQPAVWQRRRGACVERRSRVLRVEARSPQRALPGSGGRPASAMFPLAQRAKRRRRGV